MAEIYKTVLPPHLAKVLIEIVALAKQQEVLLFNYRAIDTHNGHSIYQINSGGTSEAFKDIEEGDCLELEKWGMIQRTTLTNSSGSIYLTPSGVAWADYQRMDAIERWLARNPHLLSYVVVVATVIFIVFQILQWLGH